MSRHPGAGDAPRASFTELVFSDLLRYRAKKKPTWPGVFLRCLTLPGMIASLILRAQQCLFDAGHVKAANMLRTVGVILVSADFTPGAKIGTGLMIMHPPGVTIGNRLTIGNNVTFAGGVTAGARIPEEGPQPYPVICDDVVLLANSVVVGDVRVGVGAHVGANSLVVKDVPDGAVVVGVPARRIGTRPGFVAEDGAAPAPAEP